MTWIWGFPISTSGTRCPLRTLGNDLFLPNGYCLLHQPFQECALWRDDRQSQLDARHLPMDLKFWRERLRPRGTSVTAAGTSTWAMMLAGFADLGFSDGTARRRLLRTRLRQKEGAFRLALLRSREFVLSTIAGIPEASEAEGHHCPG